MPNKYAGKTTQSGHFAMQAASAFQKSIRRTFEADALYWAAELDRSGYARLLWERILITISEDIGMGAPPGTAADVHALHENWRFFKRSSKDLWAPRLFIVHAIMILCRRAQRSRAVDNALLVVWNDTAKRELPDYSIDLHSQLGRSMGRFEGHWISEASKLFINPDLPAVRDNFEDQANHLLMERERKRKK